MKKKDAGEENRTGEKGNKQSVLSEGIIIGLATIFAYLLVFTYESSYLRYFNIPSEFVSVSLENFFIVLAGLSGFFILFYFLLDFLLFFVPKKDNYVGRRIFSFVITIMVLLLPNLYINNFKINWRYLGATALFLLFYFGYPLIFRKEKNYREKLIKQDEIESAFPSLFERFAGLFGKYGGIVLCLCVYIVYLAYLLGFHNAKVQKDFVVATINNESYAIIRTYKDNVILSRIDEGKKTFSKIFYIKSKSELSGTILENKSAGILTNSQ